MLVRPMQLHTHPAQPASITSKSCGSLGLATAFFPVVCQGHVKYPRNGGGDWPPLLLSSHFFCPLGKAVFPFSPSSKNTTSLESIFHHVYVFVCVCEHVSVVRASDPLGTRTQKSGPRQNGIHSYPSLLQLQLSLTQQWCWQVTWVHHLCFWKALSFSKSGVYVVGRLHWSSQMHAARSTDLAFRKSTIFYSMFCPPHPSGMTDFGEVCNSPRVPAS